MDAFETPATPQPEVNELRAECQSLRQLVYTLLILLLVVSGTLNLFFWRQYRVTKGAISNQQPQVAALVSEYNKNENPAISDFLRKLADFGKRNPDFTQILSKYGINPLTFTGVPPVGASAPLSPEPAKK